MTVSIWRIGSDTPSYTSEDLSGAGAKESGGRWNAPGTALLYCADTISLASLETVVHLNTSALPLNRYLVRVEIPDTLWAAAKELPWDKAPLGWDAIPAGKVSIEAGEKWIRSGKSALLKVPSVIIPEEFNILINPNHPDAAAIKAKKIRKFTYDGRLLF